MTRSIHLLNPALDASPFPQTLAGLSELLSRHACLPVSSLPRNWNFPFLLFAQELVSHFPWLPPEHENAEPAGIWQHDPVTEASLLQQACWTMILPDEQGSDLLDTIAAIAGRMKLVVFDAQAGKGYLPKGRTVPTPHVYAALNGQHLPEDAPFVSPEQAQRVLYATLLDAFDGTGFQPVPLRTVEQGLVSVRLERRIGPCRQYIKVFRQADCECLSRLTELAIHHDTLYPNDSQERPRPAISLPAYFFARDSQKIPLATINDARHVARFLRATLLAVADIAYDVTGIDQLLNHPGSEQIRTPSHFAYPLSGRPAGSDGAMSLPEQLRQGRRVSATGLVAAYVAGNPRYSELAVQYLSEYMPAPQGGKIYADYQEELSRHIAELDREQAFVAGIRTHYTQQQVWNTPAEYETQMREWPHQLLELKPNPFEARRHHLEFTSSLEKELCENPPAFMAHYGSGDGLDRLTADWVRHGETFPVTERLAPYQLSCVVTTLTSPELEDIADLLILGFPPIRNLEETQYLILIRHRDCWAGASLSHHHIMHQEGMRYTLRIQYGQIRGGQYQPRPRATYELQARPSESELLQRIVTEMTCECQTTS